MATTFQRLPSTARSPDPKVVKDAQSLPKISPRPEGSKPKTIGVVRQDSTSSVLSVGSLTTKSPRSERRSPRSPRNDGHNSPRAASGAASGAGHQASPTISGKSPRSPHGRSAADAANSAAKLPASALARQGSSSKQSPKNTSFKEHVGERHFLKYVQTLLPPTESLQAEFYCASQDTWKSVLVPGHLFVSQNFVCFHSYLSRKVTIIPMKDIEEVKKKSSEGVISNALQIDTADKKFSKREAALEAINRFWQLARPPIDTRSPEIAGPSAAARSYKTVESYVDSLVGSDAQASLAASDASADASDSATGAMYSAVADSDEHGGSRPPTARAADLEDDELALFLRKIDLIKYLPLFRKEEVDLATMRQILASGSADLKDLLSDLGLPTGPRYKILAAVAKRGTTRSLRALRQHSSSESRSASSDAFSFAIDYNELEIGVALGSGYFGEVYKAVWNAKEVAVKKLTRMSFRGSDQLDMFFKEIQILCQMRHPNIVLFMGACFSEPNVAIVTEYCPNGDLHKYLHSEKELTAESRVKISIGIAQALYYLHTRSPIIIHRDLTSCNVLLDSFFQVKIADFGLSRHKEDRLDSLRMSGRVGNLMWMAPECFRNEYYTECADIYSFGIILYELATRRVPYDCDPAEAATRAAREGFRPVIPKDCNQQWASLIRECWNGDASQRPKLDYIVRQLYALLESFMADEQPSLLQVNKPAGMERSASDTSEYITAEEMDEDEADSAGDGGGSSGDEDAQPSSSPASLSTSPVRGANSMLGDGLYTRWRSLSASSPAVPSPRSPTKHTEFSPSSLPDSDSEPMPVMRLASVPDLVIRPPTADLRGSLRGHRARTPAAAFAADDDSPPPAQPSTSPELGGAGSDSSNSPVVPKLSGLGDLYWDQLPNATPQQRQQRRGNATPRNRDIAAAGYHPHPAGSPRDPDRKTPELNRRPSLPALVRDPARDSARDSARGHGGENGGSIGPHAASVQSSPGRIPSQHQQHDTGGSRPRSRSPDRKNVVWTGGGARF